MWSAIDLRSPPRRAARPQQRGDVARATDAAEVIDDQATDLAAQLEADCAAIGDAVAPDVEIPAKKSDTVVTRVALVWLPVE